MCAVFWLAIFVVCSTVISGKTPGRQFLQGFLVSLLNSVRITAAHILLSGSYIAGHPKEAIDDGEHASYQFTAPYDADDRASSRGGVRG